MKGDDELFDVGFEMVVVADQVAESAESWNSAFYALTPLTQFNPSILQHSLTLLKGSALVRISAGIFSVGQ